MDADQTRLPEGTDTRKLAACRAYARMMNTLDFWDLGPWLTDDVQYESQWVLDRIMGKSEYEAYIVPKLKTVKRTGARVWAEIGYTTASASGPCVILAQNTPDNLVATVLLTMRDDGVSRIDMCGVPSPHECTRTGELPV